MGKNPIKGRRIYPKGIEKGNTPIPRPGEYYRAALPHTHDGKRCWICTTPNGYTSTLKNHKVLIHAGGEITVCPSIRISDGDGHNLWHGWLKKGIWTEC